MKRIIGKGRWRIGKCFFRPTKVFRNEWPSRASVTCARFMRSSEKHLKSIVLESRLRPSYAIPSVSTCPHCFTIVYASTRLHGPLTSIKHTGQLENSSWDILRLAYATPLRKRRVPFRMTHDVCLWCRLIRMGVLFITIHLHNLNDVRQSFVNWN